MGKDLNLFKLQAYGNDFLVTEDDIPDSSLSEVAIASCDRHFGVGCDGLLTLKKKPDSSFFLRIINADGSEAGMSGNGGRCAAGYLHFVKSFSEKTIRFSTISGDKVYKLNHWNGLTGSYEALMGIPAFQPESIPFFSGDKNLAEVEDFPLKAEGLNENISALSVGNPQCVLFRENLPDLAEQSGIGKAIESHPFFPEKTNVSFVRIVNQTHIKIKIWERGVGVTYSSGTGSCGAAVASIRRGSTDSRLIVETDTGKQIVEWQEGSQIKLTGDVAYVAEMKMKLPV